MAAQLRRCSKVGSEDKDMASATLRKTGYTGVEIHGHSIPVDIMYKVIRHRHTLGIEPTKANIKHAAGLRSAALFALKSDNYNEADYFPHSRPAESAAQTSKRLGDLCDRYKPLKAVDITPETQTRYENALNVCLETMGRNRLVDTLLPADIQQLRADLIATRAVSTTNHYLATFAGFLYWCENNGYCGELGKHCVRFTKSNKDPDPLTFAEYQALLDKGCLHPIDKATVTQAVYTGLRPGELPA